ncbi:MAG: hypothetical protein R2939_15290 [Kofleriaceae bacterium]
MAPEQASPAEIADGVARTLQQARTREWPGRAGRRVRTLRQQATPTTAAAVEQAIAAELTGDEQRALAEPAPASTPGPSAQGPSAPAKASSKQPAAEAKGADAGAKDAGAEAKSDGGAPTTGGGDRPPTQVAERPPTEVAERPPTQVPERAPTPMPDRPPTAMPERAPTPMPDRPPTVLAGPLGGPAAGAGPSISAAPTPQPAPEPAMPEPTPEADRALIEGELAFHENWEALSGGAGSRALHLLAGTATGDLLGGAKGAAIQTGMGLAAKLATSRGPLARIPGAGAMLGGALAGYALFANGGAGLKAKTASIANIGGAFSASNWRESPWLTAANLFAGIKDLVDLIGSICSILSGLAYAFAAIAALGGLLSWLFPPLAFLVPYIPVAVQFGRTVGGIASICSAVSDVLSPVAPLLRAIHIIFSSQDPIKLVAEEEQYHDEMQGAIANFANASVERAMDGNGWNPVAEMKEGIADGVGTVRSGATDTAAAWRSTTGGTPAPATAQAMGRGYFDAEARAGARPEQLEKAEKDLGRAERDRDYVSGNADKAQARFEADPTEQNWKLYEARSETADRHDGIVAGAQTKVAVTQQHLALGGVDADFEGDNSNEGGNAVDAFVEGLEGPDLAGQAFAARRRDAPVELARNERGHVQLPSPPGTLTEIDALDREIEQLRQRLPQQRQLTAEAAAVRADASQRGAALGGIQQTVTQRMASEQARSQQQQQQVGAQTADMQGRTNAAAKTGSDGTERAAGPLRGIAATARKVDEVLQKVPSNRFFDVSSSKRNVRKFVEGIDTITGAGGGSAEAKAQTDGALAARASQVQAAQGKHAAAASAGGTLSAQVKSAQGVATGVSAQAGQVAADSAQVERTLQQQLDEAAATRARKWSELIAWAVTHRAQREQAAAA